MPKEIKPFISIRILVGLRHCICTKHQPYYLALVFHNASINFFGNQLIKIGFVELVVEAYALVVQIVLTIVEAKMLGVVVYVLFFMMFKQFMIITSNNLNYYFVLSISIQHRWQRSLTFVSHNDINLQV
jgi:hypothetical protein